jgi:hypothetical protein
VKRRADNLPTIRQILEKADAIGDTPMSDEEARAWFECTCAENRRREKGESK